MFDVSVGRMIEKLSRIETLLDRLLIHLTRPSPVRNAEGVQVDVRIHDTVQFRGTVKVMTRDYAVVQVNHPAESLVFKYREGDSITLPLRHYSLQTIDNS